MRVSPIRSVILPALVCATALAAAFASPAGGVTIGEGTPTSAAPAGKSKSVADEVVPGRYIVVFKHSVEHPRNVGRAQARQRGGKLVFVFPVLNGYSVKNLSKGDVEALRRDPRVRYVSPVPYAELADAQTTPTGIDRTFATENEGLQIDEADDLRVDADVAVIDGGIDYEHPDLNVVARTNCALEATECQDGVGQDTYGHGTHVAGTIGALDNGEGVVGVAPGARLWAVKVFNGNEAPIDWIVHGVEWVTAHADEIEVANMSLGGPSYAPLNEAVAASAEAGVVSAVAAGNSNKDAENSSPANSPDVITVSALADYDGEPGGEAEPLVSWPLSDPRHVDNCKKVDETEEQEQNLGLDDTRATFSNYGEVVDVAAPGVCILSTFPTGDYALKSEHETEEGFGVISGTSMASPHVAGAAALLASQENPEDLEDVEAIRQAIEEEGNTKGIEEGGWEDTSPDAVQEPLLDVSDEAVFAPADQTVVTGEAEILSSSEATLHGEVNPGGAETEYYFEYGTTIEYGSKAPASGASAGSGGEYVSVEETLEGLKGQTPYHFRLVASSGEETFYGDDRVFGTTPPTVSTEPASEVSGNDAKLNADVNPEGFATTYTFEYGTSTSYGLSTPPKSLEAGTETIEVPSELINGLTDESTYHFRVVATSAAGTTNGEDETLTTPQADWAIQPIPDAHQKEAAEEDVTRVARGLYRVSCSTASDCMALGYRAIDHGTYGEEGFFIHRYPEARRWDGEAWTHYDLPVPEGIDRDETSMYSVSCGAPDSCFALGYDAYLPPGEERHMFVDHWDGEQWSAENLAMPANRSIGVESLSCSSPNSCMAATYYNPVSGSPLILISVIQVWDGKEWSEAAAPVAPEGTGASYVRAVSCVAADVCMATGGSGWAATWDGESWSEEAIPFPVEPSLLWIAFDGLSCAAADACTAVGTGKEEGTGIRSLYAAHWDGEDWTVEAMPEPPNIILASYTDDKVSCSSADDCVFVSSVESLGGQWELSERWDGEQWSFLSTDNPSTSTAVSCAQGAQSRCTAVGGYSAQRLRSSPVVTTKSANAIKASQARLNAMVNPEGLETTYQFEYVEQADFDEHGYENASSVPTSAKGIGSGTSNVAVKETISELAPETTYHFRVKATNSADTTYGDDETLTTTEPAGPALEPPGGEFPASFSLAGEQEVTLQGPAPITCTGEEEAQALSGEGQFEDASSGTATLTLRNCKFEGGFSCNTSGEAAGTIKAEDLRLRLVYLSDGEPGVLFLPNAETEQFATAKCVFELIPIEIAGNGVLGQITDPTLGEPSPTLTIDLNAPEAGEGEYAQEYTETNEGGEYGLQVAASGEEPEPAALEAEAVAEFSEGEAVLAEAGPLLEPPGGEFPASFSLAGEQEVSLRAGEEAISCTTAGEAQALGGEGQFEDATSGTATLTLRNCKLEGFECHTAGEGEGTIEAEDLRFRLVYLSDGEPGVLFLPNAETEQFATASCVFELVPIEIAGNGVLGQITDPALGEPSPTLTIDLNAPEAGEGEYAQEYTETEAGAEYGLQVAASGEEPEPAALEAEAVAEFSEGEAVLAEASPLLEPPGGEFPASFSLAGEQKVSLRGPTPIDCSGEGETQPLGGEGQFEDASSGTATLTLRNCETEGFECHTAGEEAGTIEAEGLRFRLVYLSDGEPGVLFLPNAESGQFVTVKCIFEVVSIEIAGNGVLGQITDPALGEPSPTLTIDLNAPEVGEGEYAQEYTETEAGIEYGLLEAESGEELEPAALEAEAVAEFSEGEAELTQ